MISYSSAIIPETLVSELCVIATNNTGGQAEKVLNLFQHDEVYKPIAQTRHIFESQPNFSFKRPMTCVPGKM